VPYLAALRFVGDAAQLGMRARRQHAGQDRHSTQKPHGAILLWSRSAAELPWGFRRACWSVSRSARAVQVKGQIAAGEARSAVSVWTPVAVAMSCFGEGATWAGYRRVVWRQCREPGYFRAMQSKSHMRSPVAAKRHPELLHKGRRRPLRKLTPLITSGA
jgi:hypothetical protein